MKKLLRSIAYFIYLVLAVIILVLALNLFGGLNLLGFKNDIHFKILGVFERLEKKLFK